MFSLQMDKLVVERHSLSVVSTWLKELSHMPCTISLSEGVNYLPSVQKRKWKYRTWRYTARSASTY